MHGDSSHNSGYSASLFRYSASEPRVRGWMPGTKTHPTTKLLTTGRFPYARMTASKQVLVTCTHITFRNAHTPPCGNVKRKEKKKSTNTRNKRNVAPSHVCGDGCPELKCTLQHNYWQRRASPTYGRPLQNKFW